MQTSLPIDSLLPEILQELRAGRNLVIEAPPGAGKTTRVPAALLSLARDQVWVLEPRRLAARMAARRVSYELGQPLGRTAGYQVRFEETGGPDTRLWFLTEGVLTRRCLSDRQLRRASIVVLDEFHERHLDADLALMLLRRLQLTSRPDLQIVVMSATLDAAPIAAYLDGCPVLRSEGRLFPVDVRYTGHRAEPLEEQVARAVREGLRDPAAGEGDMLVFLPGAAEIRKAARACEGCGLCVLPLHGDLSPEEQDRAVQPSERRKLILSTNVAESSVTIDGVTVVIDSGLARVAGDSPWTGLPTLNVQRISQASARQRAGRAGRTRPGLVVRLYAQEDFARRAPAEVAEIRRRELSAVLLDLGVLGIAEPPWFEAPPEEAMRQAEALLARLGVESAADAAELAALPVHPRLARLLVEARLRGCADDAARAAAWLSSGDRPPSPDLLVSLDRELPPATERIARQLLRGRAAGRRRPHAETDTPLLQSLLAAFPDRVARRRTEREALLCNGRAALLPAGPATPEFFLALDLEDRSDQPLPWIRLFARIEADWLLEKFFDRVREERGAVWNRQAERVDFASRLFYDELLIEETQHGAPDLEQAAALLATKALEAGLERFVDPEELEGFLARVEFASRYSNLAPLDDSALAETLRRACAGLRGFAELKSARLLDQIAAALPAGADRVLAEVAPDRLRIGSRMVKVHYVRGQSPWMASRLQDFFGMGETPKLARGQVPVLLHLLAPNQRPVQMTTDLKGFWERLYPQVRRELSRRYPKHRWPEDPLAG